MRLPSLVQAVTIAVVVVVVCFYLSLAEDASPYVVRVVEHDLIVLFALFASLTAETVSYLSFPDHMPHTFRETSSMIPHRAAIHSPYSAA